jgi:hypothetical protein
MAYCRKDFLDLTPIERNRLADALNQLHADGGWDKYASSHEDGAMRIHRGPVFLPWHRWFVWRLELELRAIDARVAIPYWDWTRAGGRDLDAEPWKSFFGGRNNSGGRFDHWDYERRSNDGGFVLPSLATVVSEINRASYVSFRQMEFGSHVPGHRWTGGDMESMRSPADPLFFLHHCNIDRLWAIWQLNHPPPGTAQYTLDGGSEPGFDSSVAIDAVMFADGIGGGATPGAMLDHRTLGYRYHRDEPLELQWSTTVGGTLLSGDPTQVTLETPVILFNDVPDGITTMRAVRFSVDGCARVLFEVINGPTGPFSLDESGPFAFPNNPFGEPSLYVWLLFTGGPPGSTATGLISVRAIDMMTGAEIERWNDIPISANSIARARAAVALVLDESGSMLADAGNNRDTRLEVLQSSAKTFIDQLFDDNGVALISFAETADLLTPLNDAGGLVSGVRNAARLAIDNHGPPNNQPHTCIAAGILKAIEAYATSPLTSNYATQAIVVFTDGIEDRAPWLVDIEDQIHERVYAIGVANAANVDNNKLRAIADNSNGFMLVTGAITNDDEFLLEKFFIQVLAGVTNRDIVRDPGGVVTPGTVVEIPFAITRSDVEFDAVALCRHPKALLMALKTPSGDVVTPWTLPAGMLLDGADSRTVRLTMPLVLNGQEHWDGQWSLLLALSPISDVRVSTHAFATGSTIALPYHAIVHARSSLNLVATLSQTGPEPGSRMHVVARLTEYGQPLPTHPAVRAQVRTPLGTVLDLPLSETALGVFEASLVGAQAGVYRFHVSADGFSRRGRPFTREQLLTGVIGRPGRGPDGRPTDDSGGCADLCAILECLVASGFITPELERRLLKEGFDLERLRKCLAEICGSERSEPERFSALVTAITRAVTEL